MTPRQPPKILLVRSSPDLENGRIANELDMFMNAGLDVSVLCWDRRRDYPEQEEHNGYSVRYCHVKGSYTTRALLFQMPKWWLAELLYLLRNTPDCIHAVDFDTVVPALLVKWLKRVPVVFDVYDFYTAKSRAMPAFLKPIVQWAERFCARRVNATIIVDASRTYLLGKPLPKRLVIAENCSYDLADAAWHKPDRDELVIFYGGTIAKFRGLEKLIRVSEGLENVQVVIAGRIKDENYRTILEEARHVEYIGLIDRDEVIRQTYDADAVYSYYDPVLEINRTANSTKMFEAFMCGTPVLANCEPPSARVVGEERCGSCLPYADDDALRSVIVEWRDRRHLARELGANGRRLFEERFDWRTVSERILDVYRELGLVKP